MSSRSATVLVIFIVACIAFCLASVFAAMTGPISILPNESDSGGILDNLSAITDSDNNNYPSYGYDDSQSSSSSSDDSQSNEPKVETTTDDSSSDDSNQQNQGENNQVEPTTDDSGSNNKPD
ncbi:MAG: hypothetical protein IJF83_04255 [Methanobrevibacter sp.]|nr:hypothetical protein [Methanobrevibacter sp.]